MKIFEDPVAEPKSTRTVDGVVLIDDPLLKRGESDQHLERRSRRIPRHRRPVEERLGGVGVERQPHVGGRDATENVRIKIGLAYQCQDTAGLDVERHDRPLLVRHEGFRKRLQAEVGREQKVEAFLRRDISLTAFQWSDDLSLRVHRDEFKTLGSPQKRFIRGLDARGADDVPLIIDRSRPCELAVGDLLAVPEEVGCMHPVMIDALGFDIVADAGKQEHTLFDGGEHRKGDIPRDAGGGKGGIRTASAQPLSHDGRLQMQQLRQHADVRRVEFRRRHEDGERRADVDDEAARAVVHVPAHRFAHDRAYAVLIRLPAQLLVIVDLKLDESYEEDREA